MSDEEDKGLDALSDFFRRHAEYTAELNGESDRAAAILAAANFDVWLGEVIEMHFCVLSGEMSGDLRKRLFGSYGPLSTFSAKIDIACVIGLYNEDIRKGLHTVREIRNGFAHKPRPISFYDPKISSLCEKLDTEHVPKLNIKVASGPDGLRGRYLTYLNQMKDKIYLAAMAARHDSIPGDITGSQLS